MPKIVTSCDPKRQHALDIFAAAYDDDGYTEEQKQRINLRGNELKEAIDEVLRRLATERRIFSTADTVNGLIKDGYHTACGMDAADYLALWPPMVEQPPEYIGRLDHPLLVDRTIGSRVLRRCNNISMHWGGWMKSSLT